MEYQLFTYQGYNCVALRQNWGQNIGLSLSEGNSLLIGYYCAPKGKPLSQPEAEKVLKAIGIKGVVEPEASYSTARIELKQPPSDQIVDDDSDPCAAKKKMGLISNSFDYGILSV